MEELKTEVWVLEVKWILVLKNSNKLGKNQSSFIIVWVKLNALILAIKFLSIVRACNILGSNLGTEQGQ